MYKDNRLDIDRELWVRQRISNKESNKEPKILVNFELRIRLWSIATAKYLKYNNSWII